MAGITLSEAPEAAHTRLGGWRLLAARVTWFAITGITVGVLVAAIPVRLAELHVLCEVALCQPGQVSQQGVAVLARWGISLDTYALGFVIGETLTLLVYLPVTALIFWRRSDDWLAILVSLALLTNGVASLPPVLALASTPGFLRVPADVIWSLNDSLMIVLLFLFPDGRFQPRWTRWLAPLLALTTALSNLYRNELAQFSVLVYMLIANTGYVAAVVSQVYRYRRVSGPTERQQTKWIVLGFAVFTGALIATLIVPALFPSTNAMVTVINRPAQFYYMAASLPFTYLGLYGLAIVFAIAILRYRLWDIDLIIRRTVTFGLVTAVLALLYVGSIALLQSLFIRLTGGESAVVLVISTLGIVALFAPMRRRVQAFVERRFNRSHYDAARTLELFGDVARDEVDLEKLETALLNVVYETMQPTQASLWVHDPSIPGREPSA